MNKLEQAARALLAHWDTPAWKYLKPTGDLMADLREALDHSADTGKIMVPNGYALVSIDALKAWGKYDEVRNACQFPAEQAEQKPVAIGSEWKPCMKLPVVVHVREQREGESHVSTREGITPVRPDDLIMRGVAGEEYPIGRELFNRTYTFDTAAPQTPDVCGEVCERAKLCYGCGMALDEANRIHEERFDYELDSTPFRGMGEVSPSTKLYIKELQETLSGQAEQEPVAFYIYKPTPARFDQFKGGVLDGSLPWVYDQDPSTGFVARMLVTPCAAPVRTKDLTPQDINKICDDVFAVESSLHDFARAVIAADREKNRG